MKKVLITALALMAALSTYAQGTINFQVTSSTYGVKYDNDLNGATAPIAVPTASVAGANKFQIALYYAPSGTTDPAAFTQCAGGPTDITLANGIFMGGTKTVPALGTWAFQIRGWGLGANSQFTGSSTIWEQAVKNPNAQPPDSPAAIVLGTGGFTGLTLVPEPSTIALGILGLAGLFVLRRRS